MKSFQQLLAATALASACLSPLPGLAQASTDPIKASASAELADGDVRKVDKEARKITIKHGELKGLDMPPMTMVFQVRDEKLLGSVKAGDKIRFKAMQDGAALVVTEIYPVK